MSTIDYVIVGLGNPGKAYENTRHNVGFMALDFVAQKIGINFDFKKFQSLCGIGKYNGKKIMLLKPQTYMNLSGEAVLEVMSFYKIMHQNVIVIFDDVSLPVGRLRIRQKGSHGGHNGMKSIINLCGSNEFPRIKIGVGKKPNENWDLADWVLSKFNNNDINIIKETINTALCAVESIVNEGISSAMNRFN